MMRMISTSHYYGHINRQVTARAYGVEIPFVMPDYTASRIGFVIDEVGKISYAWVSILV